MALDQEHARWTAGQRSEVSSTEGPRNAGPRAAVGPRTSYAAALAPLLHQLLGDPLPLRFELPDGSSTGADGGAGTIVIRSPGAIRRVLWAPGELGLARAYVAGDLDLRGDLFEVLRALRRAAPADLRPNVRATAQALRATYRLGGIGLPPPPPDIEASPRGRRHSKARDAEVISHHYDISNAFYRMVLGPSLTYSCARFETDTTTLEQAQASKHELICRKLGLHERPGSRLLDVGCGWGTLAIHAATHHGARVVGVTLSSSQAELARRRVTEVGLDDQVEIRVQDYRDLRGDRFDAISSVGMSEHVGSSEIATYFESLHGLLADSGRLLNHAVSSVGGSRIKPRSFIGRYVFPDGELLDVGDVVRSMEQAGFEVRDVESLREHYSKTLHAWVENLETHWDEAVAEVGIARARVWRLYMAASANGFDDGGIAVHQVLGLRPGAEGQSHMPPTRLGWS